MRGDKLTLIVAHRDRLARFGFELIQYMVEQNGGRIVVLDATVHSPESELTADLLSILNKNKVVKRLVKEKLCQENLSE